MKRENEVFASVKKILGSKENSEIVRQIRRNLKLPDMGIIDFVKDTQQDYTHTPINEFNLESLLITSKLIILQKDLEKIGVDEDLSFLTIIEFIIFNKIISLCKEDKVAIYTPINGLSFEDFEKLVLGEQAKTMSHVEKVQLFNLSHTLFDITFDKFLKSRQK